MFTIDFLKFKSEYVFFFHVKLGIRVNSINPAVIRTPIFQTIGLTSEITEQMFEEYKTKYPVGRIGEVADTSAAIAFLADSKQSSFLTGILLPVDGGSLIAWGVRPVDWTIKILQINEYNI